MEENVAKAFKMLAEDILSLFQRVLSSDVGINRKTGENTLKDSRLARTAIVRAEAPFINLIVNDYIEFIEKGTKKKEYAPEIYELREWARRKGIPATNEVLHAIQYAIWRDGIMGRPIMKTFYSLLDKEWNSSYSNMLFESIITNLTKYFN